MFTLGQTVKSLEFGQPLGAPQGQIGVITDIDEGLEVGYVVAWPDGEADYYFADEIELVK